MISNNYSYKHKIDRVNVFIKNLERERIPSSQHTKKCITLDPSNRDSNNITSNIDSFISSLHSSSSMSECTIDEKFHVKQKKTRKDKGTTYFTKKRHIHPSHFKN